MSRKTNFITELDPTHDGKKARCFISGQEIMDAKISYENELFYICQNVKSGNAPSKRYGYKKGWCVNYGTKSDLRNNDVTSLYILNEIWNEEENEY